MTISFNFKLYVYLLPYGCKSKMWKLVMIILLLLVTGWLPALLIVKPLVVSWPSLLPGGDEYYVQKKVMFGFRDKAAFYKIIRDPKMDFMLTIFSSSLCNFPCKALQTPHFLPFCTSSALFTSLPDYNRVKRQSTSHVISGTYSFKKKENLWITKPEKIFFF